MLVIAIRPAVRQACHSSQVIRPVYSPAYKDRGGLRQKDLFSRIGCERHSTVVTAPTDRKLNILTIRLSDLSHILRI